MLQLQDELDKATADEGPIEPICPPQGRGTEYADDEICRYVGEVIDSIPTGVRNEIEQAKMTEGALRAYLGRIATHVLDDREANRGSSRRPITLEHLAKDKSLRGSRYMFAGGRTQSRKTLLASLAAVVARIMRVPLIVVTDGNPNREDLGGKIAKVCSSACTMAENLGLWYRI